MYSVDKQDRVAELSDVPPFDVGAPMPVVLADDNRLLVCYHISARDASWDGTSVKVVGHMTEWNSIAIVQFLRPYAHMFGPPNDEAFAGHPLARRGLHPYGAFEVHESSWIRALERMNSVHSRHTRDWFMREKRHFVFAFHDDTFECIASGYRVERISGSSAAALQRMSKLMMDSWK